MLAGRERGVDVKRTLSLVVCGIKEATLTEPEAAQLVDDLLGAGARYPFSGGGFLAWARAQYLLP